MARNALVDLKRKITRLQDGMSSPTLESRTGFSVELTRHRSITVSIDNFDEIEKIKDELEALFVWLWAYKDYLVLALKDKYTNTIATNLVEEHVNRTPELQLTADIANTAKHGKLRKSRDGRYARLGNYATSIPLWSPGENETSIRNRIQDKAEAKIVIENERGETIGNAIDTANIASQKWIEFASQHGILK